MSQDCSWKCGRYRSCAPVLRTNTPHLQHAISSRLQGKTGRAQEQQWALNLLHPQAPASRGAVWRLSRLGANLNRAGRFLGNHQGGYKDCFPLWTGQLHRVIHGLIHQPNLKWAEGRRREDVAGQSTSPIIWHPEGAGGLELLCTRCSYWSSQVHTGRVRGLLRHCSRVRCPSQTEPHPQLRASCRDCSGCSLLLWSLPLRRQDW